MSISGFLKNVSEYLFVNSFMSLPLIGLNVNLHRGNGFSSFYYSHFCNNVHGVDIQEAVVNNWKSFENKNISFSLSPKLFN